MPRVTNCKAKEYVLNCKPFRGANIYGRKFNNGGYGVFSYSDRWPLYLYYGEQWYGNSGRYSTTTSRHARILCPADNIVKLPCALLELFVVYLDEGYHSAGDALSYVIRAAGFIPRTEQRVVRSTAQETTAPSSAVTTHLARAVVDFGAVRRRRVMQV